MIATLRLHHGKENIFYYVYAVLHNPAYRQKYELNLKRDFPRIPFYDNFEQWVASGKKLMELHLNYETVTPYPLTIQNSEIFYHAVLINRRLK